VERAGTHFGPANEIEARFSRTTRPLRIRSTAKVRRPHSTQGAYFFYVLSNPGPLDHICDMIQVLRVETLDKIRVKS
jgi:hypothetical protein